MLRLVSPKSESRKDFELSLDEIARERARRLLAYCLNLGVEEYINQYAQERDGNGRRLVVRSGAARPRTVTMDAGPVEIEAPRVNDCRDGEKFVSAILPWKDGRDKRDFNREPGATLEKKRQEREAHGEIETEHPAILGAMMRSSWAH